MKMRRIFSLVVVPLVAVSLLGSAVFAQADLKTGEDGQADLHLGIFHNAQRDNQDWVREYDGRLFDIGIESLDAYGYRGPVAYRLELRDVVLQDESARLDADLRNAVTLSVGTDAMTHRLAKIPVADPFLGAFGYTFTDFNPGHHAELERRVNDATLKLTPWKGQGIRLLAGWWEEAERGTHQVVYSSRGADVAVDRFTTERTYGTDLSLGRSSALSYRFTGIKFGDEAPPTTVPRLQNLVQPKTDTRVNTFKVRSRITNKLYLTGVQTTRNRDNNTSTGNVLVNTPQKNSTDVNATNVAVSYLATNTLNLTARYRRYSLDADQTPTFADSHGESRDESSASLESSYTGISRMFIRGGYERLSVDRRPAPGNLGLGLPLLNTDSDTSIWRLGFRSYPTSQLSLTGSWEKRDTDNPSFTGSPTGSDNLNLDATYVVADNFAVYGNYCRRNEKNTQIRVPLVDIPTSIGDPRELAAGQGFRNNLKTMMFGAWYGLTSKLTLDATYGRNKTDASALLIFGGDPVDIPNPDFAPYDVTDNIWSAGLNYALNSKWRTYGRYTHSNADGRTVLNVSDGSDPAVVLANGTWTPVSVRQVIYTIGFGCHLTAREELLFEYSRAKWDDGIDDNQSGLFDVVRVSWGHKF
jgi:hypothetical protein